MHRQKRLNGLQLEKQTVGNDQIGSEGHVDVLAAKADWNGHLSSES